MWKLIGFLVIVNAIIVTGWWVTGDHQYKGWASSICIVSIFFGIFLMLQERVVEVSVNKVGSIKAVVEQATADAKTIADIKRSIEAQRSTVDLVAKEAADAKKLVDDVALKNAKAEEKLATLDKAITNGDKAVKQLQDYSVLTSTTMAAQGDDRRAYDQLWAWSKDESCPFKNQAGRAVMGIMEQNDNLRLIPGIKWTEGVDPKTLSLVRLVEEYFKCADPKLRMGLISYIWDNRSDIPKKERVEFLVEVMRKDPSIRVINFTGGYLAVATGDGFKPLAIEEHLKWWDANKGKFPAN
ncbi:MAG TPA: hypothetical protein DET40_04805 [Lentisphaeria bacterium]|nr:MAG: hypothetical protein A2X45_13380 [Lentisphaerae bacterium GWF2_50_93]HCE42845.1 hypothetical protein [Lentisphaeria bacterium]